jgi:SAM-dependent methyltransferase
MALDGLVDLPRLGFKRLKPGLITLADRARNARQWEHAARLYRKALDRNPRNAAIWVQYGHALKESGELRDPDMLAQAETAYRRALSLNPGAADPHLQLGHALKLQGKNEEAAAAYLRAFALDPSIPHSVGELRGLGWSEAYLSELRAWVEPKARRQIHVPDVSELRGLTPRGKIAVVLHLFDADLWDEMREAIERILHPFDLFVSLTQGASDHMRNAVVQAFPQARVFDFEDHGRDLGPFLVFLQSGVLFQYDLICKLHTKRSPHLRPSDGWLYPDGDTWRRALVDGVLGSSRLVDQIVSRFRSDPALGMVVADGNIFRGHDHWVNNEQLLAELLPRLGISPDVKDRSFPGGSIFWIRSSLLCTLAGAGLHLEDFDPEPLRTDGGLGHAIERMFGLICEEAGMRILEHGQVAEPAQNIPASNCQNGPQSNFPGPPRNSLREDSRPVARKKEAVDSLHALVLGRPPESDLVDQENLGRPLIEVAETLIASEEFRRSVLDVFRWGGKLPHENLSSEDQRRVIAIAREATLQTTDGAVELREWEEVLYGVFGSGPGYEMLHRHYGPAAGHFVTMLHRAFDKDCLPDEFDPLLYLKANPDVAAAGIDPVEHYLGPGRTESRRLRPNFRPLQDNLDPEHFLDTRPSRALRPSFPLQDGMLPWPMHTFHYRYCDHDKLYRNRAVISYQYLKGDGIEVNALNAPFPKRRDSKVLYVDSMTGEQLRKRFPHLAGLAVVKPDILDDEVTLQKIVDGSKDFVILAGALPFFENPILAIQNACRVVRSGGTILVTVPDKRFSIDVRRPVTYVEHFWRDYEQNPAVSRREHYEEFVAAIINGTPADPAISPESLMAAQYPIHFHVWTHHSFIFFIKDVIERLPLECEIELLCRNEIESVCVLRKYSHERHDLTASPQVATTVLSRSD